MSVSISVQQSRINNDSTINDHKSSIFGFVPIHMQRRLCALQTRRPLPLVTASRASSSCGKRVPDRMAALEVRLGRASAVAAPAARRCRPPVAQGTSNAAERIDLLQIEDRGDDLIGIAILFQEQLH
jgi:hypothetical protein